MDIDQLAHQLIVDEEVRTQPYDDATGKTVAAGSKVVGNVTLGVGRDLNAKPLKQSEYMFLLTNDINDVIHDLDMHLAWWRQMSERRQQVIANMCFNLGINHLLGFHDALKCMQAGDYQGAADNMRQSVWHTQVHDRAERLAKMMEEG